MCCKRRLGAGGKHGLTTVLFFVTQRLQWGLPFLGRWIELQNFFSNFLVRVLLLHRPLSFRHATC